MFRTIIGIFLFIHGLIHLMGFAKAFSYGNMTQLTKEISKPMGLCWLLASCIFILSLIFLLFKKDSWWIPAVLAVILSQYLIFTNWQDTRFGTIANVLIIVATIIGYGTWSFKNIFDNEVKKALLQSPVSDEDLLTEADLKTLPDPLKKYLRYTGVVGKPKVHHFKVEFSGKLRKNEQNPWMDFSSVQYNFMDTATRLFFMKATMKNLPVAGFHSFKNGIAFMDIRLLSLFKVQYMEGQEMNEAETVTFFNDMCCMAPATLIDKRINWLEADSHKVKATFSNNNITISAWLYFNDQGALINFISGDRYAADAGKKLPWSTPLKDYKEINGYRLAGYAETIYAYPGRDLCYGTFSLTNIAYNCRKFSH